MTAKKETAEAVENMAKSLQSLCLCMEGFSKRLDMQGKLLEKTLEALRLISDIMKIGIDEAEVVKAPGSEKESRIAYG